CSHLAADLGSMAVLGTQFAELVAMSMAGKPLPEREPLEHQPLDQAEFERTPMSLRRNANAIRYWAEHLRTSPGALYPMPAPVEPVPEHLSGFLHSMAGGHALTRIVERVETGRQIVLLAAVCTVLSVRTGVSRCVFALMSGNRFRQRLHCYVGVLAQDSLLAFDVGGDDFDEIIRRVGAATLAANTHSLYDIDQLSRVMDEIGRARGIAFNRDFSFNNLSDFMSLETGPSESPDDTPTTISWLPWEHFPEMLMCHPVSLGPELVFALTADLRQVAQCDLELLLRAVERLLIAAADGVVPLDKLPQITGVEPIRRGADWVCVDSCWVELSSVRRLVMAALDVPAHVEVDERGLVAYLPAVVDTPADAHTACVVALPERYNTMAPGHYVLCAGEADDAAGWRALPVVAAGSGRDPADNCSGARPILRG
ncbi:MAG TPA: condensation domain-containing protein, partial [Pseudonocardiaceae bacterium]